MSVSQKLPCLIAMVSKTRWMLPHAKRLFLGSTDAVHQLTPEKNYSANTLSVPSIREVSRLPCANVPPCERGADLVFFGARGDPPACHYA